MDATSPRESAVRLSPRTGSGSYAAALRSALGKIMMIAVVVPSATKSRAKSRVGQVSEIG